jgi:hypothetical protein
MMNSQFLTTEPSGHILTAMAHLSNRQPSITNIVEWAFPTSFSGT